MLEASCHCGAVRISIARKPVRLTECNCSICRRYGALWAYCTRKTATVECSGKALSGYRWGDRTIEFLHCRNCGCLTHYRGLRKSEAGRIAVNARMLDPDAIAGIRIRRFDGARTWKYFPD